jgi:hypothetical protein
VGILIRYGGTVRYLVPGTTIPSGTGNLDSEYKQVCLSKIDCDALEGSIKRVGSHSPPFIVLLPFNFCMGPPLYHSEESLLCLLFDES